MEIRQSSPRDRRRDGAGGSRGARTSSARDRRPSGKAARQAGMPVDPARWRPRRGRASPCQCRAVRRCFPPRRKGDVRCDDSRWSQRPAPRRLEQRELDVRLSRLGEGLPCRPARHPQPPLARHRLAELEQPRRQRRPRRERSRSPSVTTCPEQLAAHCRLPRSTAHRLARGSASIRLRGTDRAAARRDRGRRHCSSSARKCTTPRVDHETTPLGGSRLRVRRPGDLAHRQPRSRHPRPWRVR